MVAIPRGELEELYIECLLSMQDIADIYECCLDTVHRRIKKYGIETRDKIHYLKGNRFAAGEKNHRWKGGNDQYWKGILINERGRKCEVCGFEIIIQVHHIDENRQNNNKENLILLCPNCHFSLHHANYELKKVNSEWLVLPMQL